MKRTDDQETCETNLIGICINRFYDILVHEEKLANDIDQVEKFASEELEEVE